MLYHRRKINSNKIGCKIDEIELSSSGINLLKELAPLYSLKKQFKTINLNFVLAYTPTQI